MHHPNRIYRGILQWHSDGTFYHQKKGKEGQKEYSEAHVVNGPQLPSR